ncbi:3-hydroxyacyl-CoA dehydrogenase [Undibacterium sp.]|jgi:3-hydroxybutyryl-CoA dehydrogenase|uniref:3-hydroxyacyl-CoA dehydrogenase n=1 Tax=Undibacterium sp. TaxID=1914977 RepID=UPI002C2FE85C|nr:3-hydroxyacyl-CoA dehydrogenase [Undibacterium sp.]HTD05240.1 3-hydroxyacyl-CoA dehydrogenase [Undibacterium sp.]
MSERAVDKAWRLTGGAPESELIGVVGAGTMGAGIAQVAAAAGHPVCLMDARPGAALAAREQIGAALANLVAKGRMDDAEREQILARIRPVESLTELRAAVLVVEVIVEQLEAKQALLRELEGHVSDRTILASNTSSISITALANGMQHPERLVGMHFFNPVPLMKLVEVVSGADSDAGAAAAVFDAARRWGKIPVHAESTPGFIVNRIARPFYAEALALLQEQAASPADLDRLLRAAGFKMGPCELMDLIGHDINYAVTLSVFNANYGDQRYMPSLVQKALVDGGRLGRKAGKGFYTGVPAPAGAAETMLQSASVELAGSGAAASRLAKWLDGAGIAFTRRTDLAWSGLKFAAVELHLTDGRSATRMAAERSVPGLAVMDLPLAPGQRNALAIAFSASMSASQKETVLAEIRACGLQAMEMADVPGLAVARTIAMLVNEAADAVHQGVCDQQGADLAMKLGTNYPAGPFEWLQEIGSDYIVPLLDNLFTAYRGERYRVSPLLQQHYWLSRSPK